MHIAVCVKHVPDPEAPWAQFRIDDSGRRIVPHEGVRWLMSPFDEQALEAGLRVREQLGDARITAITMGPPAARTTLKHALAMGADDAVLLDDPFFAELASDVTAIVLAAAIRKLGAPQIVLTGRQAADSDAGVVGGALAELLNRPLVTFAAEVLIEGAMLRARRVVDNGFDLIEAAMPAIVTVSNELGAARVPNLRETMRAARKPVVVWQAADIGVDSSMLALRLVRERVFEPVKSGGCEFVTGATPEAQARALAARLVAAQLVGA